MYPSVHIELLHSASADGYEKKKLQVKMDLLREMIRCSNVGIAIIHGHGRAVAGSWYPFFSATIPNEELVFIATRLDFLHTERKRHGYRAPVESVRSRTQVQIDAVTLRSPTDTPGLSPPVHFFAEYLRDITRSDRYI